MQKNETSPKETSPKETSPKEIAAIKVTSKEFLSKEAAQIDRIHEKKDVDEEIKICILKSKEPFEYTLSMFQGKWKLKILYVISCLKVVRYGELKKNVTGITHKILSEQLDDLEEKEILIRKEYPQIPPKVEYSFTEKGKTLIPFIEAMCVWGENYQPKKN